MTVSTIVSIILAVDIFVGTQMLQQFRVRRQCPPITAACPVVRHVQAQAGSHHPHHGRAQGHCLQFRLDDYCYLFYKKNITK